MMQFLIAAPSSGSGKTTVACAVLAALKKRGADPCAFKSGPDYIDPMFHRSALQVDSHNLEAKRRFCRFIGVSSATSDRRTS